MNLIDRVLARIAGSVSRPVLDRVKQLRKELLAELEHVEDRLATLVRDGQRKTMRAQDEGAAEVERRLSKLADQQAELRLMLARLAKVGESGRAEGGAQLPITAEHIVPPVVPQPSGTLPSDSVIELSACPLCGSGEQTLVCEYNKLLLL